MLSPRNNLNVIAAAQAAIAQPTIGSSVTPFPATPPPITQPISTPVPGVPLQPPQPPAGPMPLHPDDGPPHEVASLVGVKARHTGRATAATPCVRTGNERERPVTTVPMAKRQRMSTPPPGEPAPSLRHAPSRRQDEPSCGEESSDSDCSQLEDGNENKSHVPQRKDFEKSLRPAEMVRLAGLAARGGNAEAALKAVRTAYLHGISHAGEEIDMDSSNRHWSAISRADQKKTKVGDESRTGRADSTACTDGDRYR